MIPEVDSESEILEVSTLKNDEEDEEEDDDDDDDCSKSTPSMSEISQHDPEI